MRLFRHGQPGRERPGLFGTSGNMRDLSSVIPDFDAGTLSPQGLARLAKLDARTLSLLPEETRFGACTARPGKIICVGLNYTSTMNELGVLRPEAPSIAFKPSSALAGPDDDITLPHGSTATDWEVELAAFQALLNEHQPDLVPDQQLDAVCPLRPEDKDRPAERVEAEHLLHSKREAVDPLAVVHRPRRHVDLYRPALAERHDIAARIVRVSSPSSAAVPARITSSPTTISISAPAGAAGASTAAPSTTNSANIGSAAMLSTAIRARSAFVRRWRPVGPSITSSRETPPHVVPSKWTPTLPSRAKPTPPALMCMENSPVRSPVAGGDLRRAYAGITTLTTGEVN